MTLNTSTTLLCLIFLFSVAHGGYVERLVIDEDYGSDCNATVSCYVYSSDDVFSIEWQCIGGPYGISDMKQIPGLRMGDIKSVELPEYKQSVTLSKCYSKLVFTCKLDDSSKTVTLTSNSWVESLDIDKDYGPDCNANVSCYVHSGKTLHSISWKCVGGPFGITDMNLIPGLRMGDITSIGLFKYKQSVTLSKCYSKLVLTCKVDNSSRTVTLNSNRWVERLDIDKDYGSDCNAIVSCYVHSGTTLDLISWKCVGGPSGITDIKLIPGLRIEDIRSVGLFEYKQSVILSKCYSKLLLTCEVEGSSRTVTLTSSALSAAEIVGIVIGVVLGLSAIGGCIWVVRRKRTRGVIVGGIENPMANIVAPTNPVHPTPADYPGYPNKPPNPTSYPGVSTKEENQQ